MDKNKNRTLAAVTTLVQMAMDMGCECPRSVKAWAAAGEKSEPQAANRVAPEHNQRIRITCWASKACDMTGRYDAAKQAFYAEKGGVRPEGVTVGNYSWWDDAYIFIDTIPPFNIWEDAPWQPTPDCKVLVDRQKNPDVQEHDYGRVATEYETGRWRVNFYKDGKFVDWWPVSPSDMTPVTEGA